MANFVLPSCSRPVKRPPMKTTIVEEKVSGVQFSIFVRELANIYVLAVRAFNSIRLENASDVYLMASPLNFNSNSPNVARLEPFTLREG